MKKLLIISITYLLLTSCSSNKSEKPLETGQTKGEPTKPITQEKSPDIKRIDEQAALINLLVSNPDDYCSTERRIKKLGSIATTDDGKKYASSKIVELFGIIEPKTKEIVDDYWEKYFDKNLPGSIVQGTIENEFKKQNKRITVVSANYIDKETIYEKKNRKRTTNYNFIYTIREHTGILSADNYYSVKAYCRTDYILNCEESDISYSGYIRNITKTNNSQPNGEWK